MVSGAAGRAMTYPQAVPRRSQERPGRQPDHNRPSSVPPHRPLLPMTAHDVNDMSIRCRAMIDDGRGRGKPGPMLVCCGGFRHARHRGPAVQDLSRPDRPGAGRAREIALTVEPEEFVAVLSSSGCGKSAPLRHHGRAPPAASFEGERRAGPPQTATVFQEFALFPWRTARANVELGLEELGAARRNGRTGRRVLSP
jgi:hypothetical protein